MIERILILFLFMLGIYGLMAKRNLIKKVYALTIQNSAVVLLFILEGSRIGTYAPLMGDGLESERLYVDPVPQALMLTAIVVGLCVTALALALVYRLYRAHGTLDADELKKRIEDAHL